MMDRLITEADKKILQCLDEKLSFSLTAGAGSGKTSSLIDALNYINSTYGKNILQNGQKVACITYTKRAVQVILNRVTTNELFVVTTLHSFLWNEIKGFTSDIKLALKEYRLPDLISQASSKDKGGNSIKSLEARARTASLSEELANLDQVKSFKYNETTYSKYAEGQINHDDVIEIAGYLLKTKPIFRKALGFRYPFIFIDEAQDTFPVIIEAFNLSAENGFPVIGYFGDPWQQIYDNRAGIFNPPNGGVNITKTENFRCSTKVIDFLNKFRTDVTQYPAGKNKHITGSVKIALVAAESPAEPRNRYSEDQIERALLRMHHALQEWGWLSRNDIIKLFLARQMIARRLGFSKLNKLFTGKYISTAGQDAFEAGTHFLLAPIIDAIWPLIKAYRSGNQRLVIDLLRKIGPAFDVNGKNQGRSLKEMVILSKEIIAKIDAIWQTLTIKEIYEYCRDIELIEISPRLLEHLSRKPRTETYNDEEFSLEKTDWLCDSFFQMHSAEIERYCEFMLNNSAFSTQHGVKGEEYKDVLVVFDDIEAAWSNYNFNKLLTPNTSGIPTNGQYQKSEKLAYVCFSRAEHNLRILLYTNNPAGAKNELLKKRLFTEDDILII